MYVLDTFGLQFHGVADPGVANQERIVLRPTRAVDLAAYFVGIGVKQPNGMVVPLRDNVFWFPSVEAQPTDWIFIYTGRGVDARTFTDPDQEPAFVYHWGKSKVVFANPSLVPFVFQRGSVIVGHQIR